MKTLSLASVCILLFCCGCETTGDPRSGGLFGWSKDKADQRQSDLRTASEGVEQKRDWELARNKDLASKRQEEQAELISAQTRLQNLLSENRDAEVKLELARKNYRGNSSKLNTLLEKLDHQTRENRKQAKFLLERQTAEKRFVGGLQDFARLEQDLRTENERLTEALILLSKVR